MVLETAPRIFRETVQKYGDRVAMRKKEYGLWHDISWNDYYRLVRQVGSALISLGLQKGDCVSIIGDNCPEWVIADLADPVRRGSRSGHLRDQCLAAGRVCDPELGFQVLFRGKRGTARQVVELQRQRAPVEEGHRVGPGGTPAFQRSHGHDL